MKRKNLLILIAFFITIFSAIAKTSDFRIAILPFTGKNLEKDVTKFLTLKFETSVIRTKVFTVIEQRHLKEIFEAQKISFNSWVDEDTAIKVGKIAAANAIVWSSLQEMWGEWYLNIKVIDIETGTSILADEIVAPSPKELLKKIDEIAINLAGQTSKVKGFSVSSKVTKNTGNVLPMIKVVDDFKIELTKVKIENNQNISFIFTVTNLSSKDRLLEIKEINQFWDNLGNNFRLPYVSIGNKKNYGDCNFLLISEVATPTTFRFNNYDKRPDIIKRLDVTFNDQILEFRDIPVK